jgi:hypothetical protein
MQPAGHQPRRVRQHQQGRDPRRPLEQLEQRVDQRVVGPVHVVDQDDQVRPGELLEHLPDRLLRGAGPAARGGRRTGVRRRHRGQRRGRCRRRGRTGGPGLGPVRDQPGEHQHAALAGQPAGLGEQPRLAGARVPGDGQHVQAPVGQPVQRRRDDPGFTLPAGRRSGAHPARRADPDRRRGPVGRVVQCQHRDA